jgi:hypothetical protein
VEGAARNIWRAASVVGRAPLLENVATIVQPPGTMNEAEWTSAVLDASGGLLLLDLHNLHANATNFAFDARRFVDQTAPRGPSLVHLAGGRLIPAGDGSLRILDDHLHATPEPVFELLEHVAERAQGPLTVVLERDGRYPSIEELLLELTRAREALAKGRERKSRKVA